MRITFSNNDLLHRILATNKLVFFKNDDLTGISLPINHQWFDYQRVQAEAKHNIAMDLLLIALSQTLPYKV